MKTNTKRITHYIMALVSIVVLVLLDQITKHLVVLHLKDRSAYVLIKDVFQLEYLENRGAAFGVLQNQRIFFYISVLLMVLQQSTYGKKISAASYLCSVNSFRCFRQLYRPDPSELCSRFFILQADQLPDF